ncbi:extracellular solute-binding protein [Paenibacillus agricola]|uniref:Extracellular solute-binding protein n=1 Tax=Paenibacillus agricola TaxID=2716264 RepID=A0ABX0J346_9BACL|nr:extracellular solute-binding protein [Paenibacillus agricola]NHN29830.1 extracellular solute-binding protein [Paenibacillus agricola]
MTKKRTLLSSLCIVISGTLVLSACSEANKETVSTAENTSEAKINPAGQYPISNDKINLKVLTQQDVNVENLETNDFTKWYESKTNVHVEWEVVPKSAAAEKLQVKLAGGDLPEVFMSAGITDSQLVAYGSQGLFMPLNDLIDKYAPNVKKMMKNSPWLDQYMYTPDGKIYSIPNVGETFHATMPKKMFIYKPWLDKLGLKMPTTTEELYNVLMAFKTKDPNGNGKADEIPLSGANGTTNSNNEPESFIMQSFVYYDKTTYLMVDKGLIEFAADKPGYKEGLKYMHKLVQGGLLQPDAFIQDRKALTALAEDPAGSRLGAGTALYWGNMAIDNGPSGRYKDYAAVPILKGPDGQVFGFDRGHVPSAGAFVITRNNKNPEASMRWIDWFFDEHAKLNEGWSDYLGQEGVGWKKPDAGLKGIDGRPATYQMIMPFGTKNNNRWTQTAPRYQDEAFRMSLAATPEAETEVRLQAITKELYKPYSKAEMQVPHMFFKEEDLMQFGDIQKNISTVVQDFMLKFVTGSLDIDKDWNKYTQELDNAGLQQYLKIVRDSYSKIKK